MSAYSNTETASPLNSSAALGSALVSDTSSTTPSSMAIVTTDTFFPSPSSAPPPPTQLIGVVVVFVVPFAGVLFVAIITFAICSIKARARMKKRQGGGNVRAWEELDDVGERSR